MNIRALEKLSYGLYIASSKEGDQLAGCVVNAVTQVTSFEPVIVALSINKENYTTEIIQKSGKFSVSVLSQETDRSLIASFGFASSRNRDKFKDVRYEIRQGVPVLLDHCSSYFTCDVLSCHDARTHLVVLGQVTDCDYLSQEPPMTYEYYHTVIKGKAPKTAPTYRPEQESGKWVCSVCQYVYDGDFAALPQDWVCPICGAPKSAFHKQ